MMNGLLLVDKPKGWTSFDVVAKVRGLLRTKIKEEHEKRGFCTEMQSKEVASSAVNRTSEYVERAAEPADTAMRSEPTGAASFAGRQGWRCKCHVKVGHTGTLDSLATGLLVLCLGSYCKRAQEYSKLDKTYEVKMKLGETSTTDDGEGEKTLTNQPIPDKSAIKQAILSFQGEIEQVPPAFSAIKVDGKRAYKLAREGKQVELKPRKVTIYSIKNIKPHLYKDGPCTVAFGVGVSSGTYIRSLVRDIGEKLGCGAYMTDLKRTTVGQFRLKDAHKIDTLTAKLIQASVTE